MFGFKIVPRGYPHNGEYCPTPPRVSRGNIPRNPGVRAHDDVHLLLGLLHRAHATVLNNARQPNLSPSIWTPFDLIISITHLHDIDDGGKIPRGLQKRGSTIVVVAVANDAQGLVFSSRPLASERLEPLDKSSDLCAVCVSAKI